MEVDMAKEYKTRIYVDGYNFYYGLLERSPYKWLNIGAFLSELVTSIQPSSSIDRIYFFTADVKARWASHGQRSVQSQAHYLGAMRALDARIKVLRGDHDIRPKKAPIFDRDRRVVDRGNTVNIWHIEEKKTDVELGVHLVRDAIKGQIDQIVLVSNDTDHAPALKMAKTENPALITGVIFPVLKGSNRYPNTELAQLAAWTRKRINSEELIRHQLPRTVPKPNGRGVYRKPIYW